MEPQNSYIKILIIEDDASLRAVLVAALASEGYATYTAENGRQALDLLASMRPHVILTDLNMPVMDGWGFIAEKQRDSSLRSIPLIALSAALESLTIVGVTRFIQKPFSLETLFAALAECCPL